MLGGYPLRVERKTVGKKTRRGTERKLKAGGQQRTKTEVLVLDIRTCTPSAGGCNSKYGTTADEVLGSSSHRTTLSVTCQRPDEQARPIDQGSVWGSVHSSREHGG